MEKNSAGEGHYAPPLSRESLIESNSSLIFGMKARLSLTLTYQKLVGEKRLILSFRGKDPFLFSCSFFCFPCHFWHSKAWQGGTGNTLPSAEKPPSQPLHIMRTEDSPSTSSKGIYCEYPRGGVLGRIFRFPHPQRRKTRVGKSKTEKVRLSSFHDNAKPPYAWTGVVTGEGLATPVHGSM